MTIFDKNLFFKLHSENFHFTDLQSLTTIGEMELRREKQDETITITQGVGGYNQQYQDPIGQNEENE